MKYISVCFIMMLLSMMATHAQYGLIACYPLDNNPNDFSGNNHNGTSYNLTPATDRFGNPNHAYHFSGNHSGVIINDSVFMLNDFTYSAWFKLDTLPSLYYYYSVFAIGGNIADQSILIGNNPGNGGNIGIGAGSWDTIPAAHHCYVGSLPNSNQWYHVVVTRDNDSLKLYIDNNLICFQATGNTAGYLGNYNDASIGSRGDTAIQNFIGDIDEVKIFDHALTPSEVASIDSVCTYAAAFAASSTSICEKFCIDFTDQSTNNPISWLWLFPGGAPSFSTDQNPANICYNLPGTYDVTLISTNANGSDTLTLSNYVTVNATPSIPVITQNGYTLTSSSAAFYQWQFNSVDILGATNQSYDIMQSGYYTVVVTDSNGCVNSAMTYVLIEGVAELANQTSVSVVPNPFSISSTIFFSIPASQKVSVLISDATGRVIKVLTDELETAGAHAITWNVRDDEVSAGIYFLKFQTANDNKTIRLSIVK